MKRILLLLMFSPFVGRAQNKISGLGEYIIGKTTISNLRISPRENDIDTINADTPKNLSDKQIWWDLFYKSNEFVDQNKKVRKFIIEQYPIGHSHYSTVLSFYDDTLFSIFLSSDNVLGEALRGKYGNGIQMSKKPFSLCKRFSVLAYEKTTIWRNGNIQSRFVEARNFEENCDPDYFSFFEIKNTKKEQMIIKETININSDTHSKRVKDITDNIK